MATREEIPVIRTAEQREAHKTYLTSLKREKIREGVADILAYYAGENKRLRELAPFRRQVYLDQAFRILEYEDSQGLMIKMEKELPKGITNTRSCFTSKNELHAFDTGYFTAQQDMVEPLLKEVVKDG